MFHVRIVCETDLSNVYEFTICLLKHHLGENAQSLLDYETLVNLFKCGFLKGLLLVQLPNSKHSSTNGIINKHDTKPIGCMIYHSDFSPLHGGLGFALDQFYIQPEFRHQGLGQLMMSVLCKEALTVQSHYIKLSFQDGIGLETMYAKLGFVNHTRGPPGVHVFEVYGKENLAQFLKVNDSNENGTTSDWPNVMMIPTGQFSRSFYPNWSSVDKRTLDKDTQDLYPNCLPDIRYIVAVSSKENSIQTSHLKQDQGKDVPLYYDNHICIYVEQCCVCSWLGPMINFSDFIGDLSILSKHYILERVKFWTKLVPELCGAVWEVPCGASIRPDEYAGKIITNPDMSNLKNIPLANTLIDYDVADDTMCEGWNINYLNEESMKLLSQRLQFPSQSNKQ